MAKIAYPSVKTTMWGVFYIGNLFGGFRILKAAFAEKDKAETWAKNYSKENFGCTMTVEEIKVTVPAWDGTVPNPLVTNPLEV